MTKAADRYFLRGGPIPRIYPGTLKGLTQAIKDGLSASRFLSSAVRLFAVHGSERTLVRSFTAGNEDADLSVGTSHNDKTR